MATPARTAADLAERLLHGDKRALARAVSLVENDDPRAGRSCARSEELAEKIHEHHPVIDEQCTPRERTQVAYGKKTNDPQPPRFIGRG